MEISYYKKKYEPIDGKWYINKRLGSGAFGTVFEIERKDFNHAKSALKVITIPSSQSEVSSYREENFNLDNQSITSYFYGFVEEFTKEFELMTKLRGNSNIVSIEDFDVKKHDEEIGWDILIRMELLTPMNKYFANHSLTQQNIIKLGIDICKALEVCQKYKIIHRDIKPSNIFVSDTGEFKLGDFGVARTLEKTSSGLSKKGTYTYMAPEVYSGNEYGSNVDIYSLGIVMYKLLNNNFEPFRIERTHTDEEKALVMRMKGEMIPKPENADGRLAEIVLKACSFNPKDRYESPLQMRKELESILYSEKEKKDIYPQGDTIDYEPTSNGTADETGHGTVGLFDEVSPAANMPEEQKELPTEGIFQTRKLIENDDKTVPISQEVSRKSPVHRMRKSWIVVCGILILAGLVGIGINLFMKQPMKTTTILDEIVAEIKIMDEINNIVLTNDDIESVSKDYDPEIGEYISLNLTDAGQQKFADATFANIGKTLGIYVNDELISNPQVSGIIDSASVMISGMDTDELNALIEKLKSKKMIDAKPIMEQLNEAHQYMQNVQNSTSIDLRNVEMELNALEQLFASNGIPEEITDAETLQYYTDFYNNDIKPAVEALKKAYDKAIEIEQNKSNENNNNLSSVISTPTEKSTQPTAKPSNTIPAKTPQSTPAEIPETPKTQPQPTCPVCGSKYHSVHPSDEAPVITKEFD